MATSQTPLRGLGTPGPEGSILLRDVGSTYRDGGEADVLRLLRDADDLSSTNDELLRNSTSWPQTYHLHPARANIVRCLDLPETARVLEIGAGCGAITRYLGEACALVDALEPVPSRAAAAKCRTRDLDNVEVFVGQLDDVPAEPAYDIVVVIGVLEYVADGSPDRAPYLAFLRGIRQRLVDGGTLVLAIENQLGVKYLAGAPEDHSNRMFDGIEGYPGGSPARTFSRRQLTSLVSEAGLQPSFRSAFPDYKITRAVLGDFPEPTRSLLHRIPQFPSPDWAGPRPPLADERSLWRSLVEAGLEGETGNSFLVLAGKNAASAIWPADAAAVFYSVGRRTRLAAQTVVRREGDTVRFCRRPLIEGASRPGDRFTIAGSDYPYQPGQDLVGYVAVNRDVDLRGLISAWLKKLDSDVEHGAIGTIDIVPHNLVITDDGELHVIDVELFGDVPREQIVRRGLFWMARHVAQLSPPGRWGDAQTVGDLARLLGEAAGQPADGSWLDLAHSEEVAVQLEVHSGPQSGMTPAEWEKQFDMSLRAMMSERLEDQPLANRLPDHLRVLHAMREIDRAKAEAEKEGLRAELAEVNRRLEETQRRFDEVTGSLLMRVVFARRELAKRMLPQGTRRREAVRRLLRKSG